jgi:cytochrome c biogenesis protein CcmG, thiol:disulfide interchange protein DsbE
MIRRLLIVAALAVGATACSSSGSVAPGPSGSGTDDAQVAAAVKAAHLSPCPASSPTAVAGALPNVTLSCLGHGPAVHMAGLTGRPLVVNVWGSWCIPCQAEAGYLSSAADSLRHRVQFLGVDTEDSAYKALTFDAAVRPPVHYPSVNDPDKKVLLGIHYPGPPETVFIDSTGKIVHIHGGEYTSAAAVTKDISTYLHVST